LQVIASTLSQFAKKWATILPELEIALNSLFSIFASSVIDGYPLLSLLCQSVAYLMIALIGDVPLKDLVEGVFEGRETLFDRSTSVAHLRFMDFARQPLQRSVQLQLVAACLLSLLR
jgi:hypothetical protein